ncbi:ArsR/SmtB family transcription factor [Pedobacter nanyangensis]|uniref:ArsR/SmtB family transcription factor n=1 Tax=Pedobacter nanyangensis TaxID=1562389 RepID=UPI000DE224B4|nr:metalloregulator ArsR/SmtB family transcription factor [Pedobacter nanyangensis]
MNRQEFKDSVYSELSKVSKAIANPVRLEIIDLLVHGPLSVEQIAYNIDQSVANASQHLQKLKNAKLVKIEREGNFIYYSLTGDNVFRAWIALRDLGIAYNAEVKKIIEDFRAGYGSGLDAIDLDMLKKMLENNEVILLDVRPEEDFNRGHIHKAICVPIDKLKAFIQKLPHDKTVVAYCRGPLCIYSDMAVAMLKDHGYDAKRTDEGYPEWKMKGYPIQKTQNHK